jgi:hypothetical protein
MEIKACPWVKCSERIPTIADADNDGKVLVSFRVDRSVIKMDWRSVSERLHSHWMPTPKPPDND